MSRLADSNPSYRQLAIPIVLDRYTIKGAGPAGGSSYRFAKWLDQYRARKDVRLLHAIDNSEVVVIAVDAALVRARDGYWTGVPK